MIKSITNGLGVIKIGLSEKGSYFEFNSPKSIVWLGGGYGTTANYFRLLPYSEKHCEKISKQINHATCENYIGRPSEAINAIHPILELFENGVYEITYSDSENIQFFMDEDMVCHWSFYIPKTIEYSNERAAINAYKKFKRKNSKTKGYFCPGIVDFSTYGFHVGSGVNLIATQPLDVIEEERVKFYENEIISGKRPFAIIVEKYCQVLDNVHDKSLYSELFVLDGHHKLLAYRKLNIYPPILNIKSICNKEELFFDTEKVKLNLFQWQYEHLTNQKIAMDRSDNFFKCLRAKIIKYFNKNRS